MREFWNKGIPKPYRDRRKIIEYTKSENVPYFLRVVKAGYRRAVDNIIHIGAGVGTKAAKAGVLMLVASVIGCNLYKVIDTPDYEEDDTQVVLQSDDAAAIDASVSVPDVNQCVVDVNSLQPKPVADSNVAGAKPVGSAENDPNRYLNAVREFADNVLKYGRDTYGPKHTPLFVDGLNVNKLTPVEWIAPNGERWVLSNLASQQNLFRTLDGLTRITGDPKYKQAAMDAIEYAFDNLRSPNGLLYWGGVVAYDAHGEDVCGEGRHQTLKYNYPYYGLMWEVDPEVTNKFIEAFWVQNILDWSNLDMNRYSRRFGEVRSTPKGWDYEYEGGQVFFKSTGSSFFNAGSDLFYAAAILSKLSGEKEPLVWSKRLAHRYIETRNPKTGIGGYVYSRRDPDEAQIQLGDDFKEHLVLNGTLFPAHPEFRKRTIELVQHVRGWICELLLGDLLGADGKEFHRWALEELVAWGKAAYRKEDNSFIPMLTDGTSLEGYVFKKGGYYGPKGMVIRAWPLGPIEFWAYSLAYRMSGDEYIWEMARNIGQGSGFGDIGATPMHESRLQTDTACADHHVLLGFLELYKATAENRFLEMAQRIGDNILSDKFYRGFFVSSKEHIYTRFDVPMHLALLHLHAAMKQELVEVPRVWPSCSAFLCGYRNRLREFDIYSIYKLTESPELPISLHEAATLGDINKCTLLISQGTDIDAWDQGSRAPLHYAAMNGHKQVVELLLGKGSDVNTENVNGSTALDIAAREGHINVVEFLIGKGADVNAKDRIGLTPLHNAADGGHREVAQVLITSSADVNVKDMVGDTPLHSAARGGNKDIVELLVAKGADINAKNNEGQTPVDIAVSQNRKDIVELLITKGADISLHAASRFGNLAIVKSLIEEMAEINTKDASGKTALHYAVEYGHKDVVELFIANGADVNVKNNEGQTPADVALLSRRRNEVVKLLVDKGADVSSIHLAAYLGDTAKVMNFIEQGSDVNTKDQEGLTPLHYAAMAGSKEVSELLLTRGADIKDKDKDGATPLHWGSYEGHRDLAEFLITKGADIDARDDRWSETPLHYAAYRGHKEVVELLIAKGANIRLKDKDGYMPLQWAVYAGHRDVTELLIVKGADVNVKGNDGKTALSLAKEKGQTEIVELLRKHGAKEDKAPEGAPKEEKPSDPNDVEVGEPNDVDIIGKAESSGKYWGCLPILVGKHA